VWKWSIAMKADNSVSGLNMLDAHALEKILGSRTMAYRLFNTEGFPSVRIGKRVFVREDRFIKWLEDQEGHPSAVNRC
jgi:hypothetical protein